MRTRTWGAAAIALILSLTGCVNMSGLSGSSRYSCAAPKGVACDSISGTYANAVRNNLPSQQGLATSGNSQASSSRSTAGSTPLAPAPRRPEITGLPNNKVGANLGTNLGTSLGHAPGLALRSQARILRLWTKPWEDADGDLWDQGYVYVQVDAGRWQIDHVRQRIRDQYAPLRPPPASSSTASAGETPTAPNPNAAETQPSSLSGSAVAQRPASPNPLSSLAPSPARPAEPGLRPQ
jgi:conjugal transfer pilus assembly protein TraV